MIETKLKNKPTKDFFFFKCESQKNEGHIILKNK
jgi:hypothetical protein